MQEEQVAVGKDRKVLDDAGPDVTPDCCPQWRAFAPRFDWYRFEDFPGLACMPFVPMRDKDTGEIHKWRVNHCPACGADRRGVIMWVDDLEHSN